MLPEPTVLHFIEVPPSPPVLQRPASTPTGAALEPYPNMAISGHRTCGSDLILALLTVLRAGVSVVVLNGKSRLKRLHRADESPITFGAKHTNVNYQQTDL